MKSLYSVIAFFFFSFYAWAQVFDEKILEGFDIRNIGPAGMSGRITAIDVVLSQPNHIYIGSASGGVWESTDGGVRWDPIFDDQPSLAIGAIKINQQNPSEIWVGTGEGNPRNSHNSGKGIFRTLDGGKTWTHMGLSETKTIHRILIDPHQPSTIYVGGHGSAWGANPERGVFKSTDSGKTWKKILFSNERSGVADMVMDPSNPRKIIAALWEYGRTPWDFNSGGEGSGLHITYDGGESWKKITSKEGLPDGHLGRIGLAIAASSPEIVYALVEAKENGLYKSIDGGETWSLISTKNIGNRPFYYHEIYVDPQNENRIWNLYSYVSKSEDGGRTFETILDYGKGVHPDHHAFWIHPDNPDYIIDGNDGGLNISRDGGRNWYFAANIPVGQFYHINVDHEYPYNIYGGMQDNGSWVGPAFVLKSGGIRNNDWRELYFGDGFDVLPNLENPRYGWAMSQGGNLTYYDRETGFNQFVKPVHPDNVKLRYNWNAALAAVPGTSCGIYFGSQFLHRSDDCGQSWRVVSPDLTTNDTTKQKQETSGGLTTDATTAENHTTILSIAPSTINPDVIWVGTDDGNVQLTKDGGRTWNNLISKMPGAPSGAWIPQIEASSHNAGEAFVVINNYRRDDWKPYVYHTMDYGATWSEITNENQITSFVQAIVQDPVVPHLLFLGADDGLYVSIDKGANWNRFSAKVFPRVSTMDLKIHPQDHSLAIATFGRSLWILDNLLPLREIASDQSVLKKMFTFFDMPSARQTTYRSVDGVRFTADAEFKGENRIGGARYKIYIKPKDKKEEEKAGTNNKEPSLKKKNANRKSENIIIPEIKSDTMALDSVSEKSTVSDKDHLKLYVIDQNRDTVRYIRQKLKEGWNDVGWDMRAKGVRYPSRRELAKDADDPSGIYVMPGVYTLIGIYNGHKDSTKVIVELDPRLNITDENLIARKKLIDSFYEDVDRAHNAFRALQDVRKDLKMIESLILNAPDSTQEKIKKQQKELMSTISSIEEKFMDPEDVKGYTNNINLSRYLSNTSSYLNSALGEPGQNAQDQLRLTHIEVDKLVSEVSGFLESDWKAFKDYVKEISWPLFKSIEPLK